MFSNQSNTVLPPFYIQPSLLRLDDVEINLKMEDEKEFRRVRNLGHGVAALLCPIGSVGNISKTFLKFVGSGLATGIFMGSKTKREKFSILTARYGAKLAFKTVRFVPTVATTYVVVMGYLTGVVSLRAGKNTLEHHMKLKKAFWEMQFKIERKFTVHKNPLEDLPGSKNKKKNKSPNVITDQSCGQTRYLKNFANILNLLLLSYPEESWLKERENVFKIIEEFNVDEKTFCDYERLYRDHLGVLTHLERFVYFAVFLSLFKKSELCLSNVYDEQSFLGLFSEILDREGEKSFLLQGLLCLSYYFFSPSYRNAPLDKTFNDNLGQKLLSIFWGRVQRAGKEEKAVDFLLKNNPKLLLYFQPLDINFVQEGVRKNASKLTSSLDKDVVIKYLEISSISFGRNFLESLDSEGRKKLFGGKLSNLEDYGEVFKALCFNGSNTDKILTSLIPSSRCFSLIEAYDIPVQLSFLKVANPKQIKAVYKKYKLPEIKSLKELQNSFQPNARPEVLLKNLEDLRKDSEGLKCLRAYDWGKVKKNRITPFILETMDQIDRYIVDIEHALKIRLFKMYLNPAPGVGISRYSHVIKGQCVFFDYPEKRLINKINIYFTGRGKGSYYLHDAEDWYKGLNEKGKSDFEEYQPGGITSNKRTLTNHEVLTEKMELDKSQTCHRGRVPLK